MLLLLVGLLRLLLEGLLLPLLEQRAAVIRLHGRCCGLHGLCAIHLDLRTEEIGKVADLHGTLRCLRSRSRRLCGYGLPHLHCLHDSLRTGRRLNCIRKCRL